MNLWECDHESFTGERCPNTATGTGPAKNLEAIGWVVKEGDFLSGKSLLILCPVHQHGDNNRPTLAKLVSIAARKAAYETTRDQTLNPWIHFAAELERLEKSWK